MQRVKRTTAVAVLPADPVGGTPGYFPQPNPGGGVPAAVPGYEWYNNIQEEICAPIEAMGITLDGSQRNQLYQAIQAMIARGPAKMPVRAATTANITTLAGGAPSTLDGVSLAAGDRILVKDQTTASQNGIYTVTTVGTGANGTWARAADADGAGEMFPGMLVVVTEGTTQADQIWELATNGAITVGTTALAFARTGAQPDASTTVKGIVQLATSTEAQALTDALKAITPATLAAVLGAGGASAADYVKIPFKEKTTGVLKYLIVQWGNDTSSASAGVSVVFPLAFPTLCAAISVTHNGVTATVVSPSARLQTTTGFTLDAYTSNTGARVAVSCGWVAIGY